MKKSGFVVLAVSALFNFITVSAEAQTSLQLDKGWSLSGMRLTRGESVDSTRNFVAYRTYNIFASGSDNARDIDLVILDSRGREVVKDTKPHKDAQVAFRPTKSGQYTVRLKLDKTWSQSTDTMCWFGIGEESGGWNVPVSTLFSTMESLGSASAFLSVLDRYNAIPWRIYGFVLEAGESHSMDLTGLPSGSYALLALGSNSAWDLDLEVFQNGRRIANDTLVDALPICQFGLTSGKATYKLTYESGSGPALVLVALYD